VSRFCCASKRAVLFRISSSWHLPLVVASSFHNKTTVSIPTCVWCIQGRVVQNFFSSVRFAPTRFMLPPDFLWYPWEDLDMLMAANEEAGISGMGDIEQLPPEGILINILLPTSSTNEGSTNTTDLAPANYTLLQMVSFALSIWFQGLLASLGMLGYSKSHAVSGYMFCFLRSVLRSVEVLVLHHECVLSQLLWML